VKQVTLEAFVNEAVSEKVSLLCTDQWVGYKHLGDKFNHGTVDHAKHQYVVGAVHTQTIEGFGASSSAVSSVLSTGLAKNTCHFTLRSSNSGTIIALTTTFSERRLKGA